MKAMDTFYVAVNKANPTEVHSFEWTTDNRLIICGQEADPSEWDIIQVSAITAHTDGDSQQDPKG